MKFLDLKKRQPDLKKKKNLNELFNKAETFFKALTPKDKIVLIYHMDMDGVCSAAIIHRSLKKLSTISSTKIKISKTIVSTYKEIEGILEILGKFDKIIIVDIGINQDVEIGKRVLLIDHHSIKRDLNSESVIFVNPRFENEEVYQPSSYVVYKLISRIIDIRELGWISAVGIISDWGYDDCRDVLDDWVKVDKKDELFHTKFGQLADILLGASYVLGFNKILDALIEAKSMKYLESNKGLTNAYKKYDIAFQDGKKQFWENVETFGNVIFSIIKPSYRRLSSPIINHVSFENPDKIIFLLERMDDVYKVGARYQRADYEKKINLSKVMKKCCDGGGHRAAAGGSIKIGDIQKFKRCVIKELKGLV